MGGVGSVEVAAKRAAYRDGSAKKSTRRWRCRCAPPRFSWAWMARWCRSGGTMQTYIAIVGSRSYPRPDLVQAYVAGLPGGCVVVSGGAPGVDSVAEAAAKAAGLETVVFHADWESLGRRAGPIRKIGRAHV